MTQADGEKELILGNRQLISLFFVVVALCGVFFAMGYIIGRNSTKAALGSPAADAATAPSPTVAARQQPEPPRETAQDPAPPPVDQQAAPVDAKPAPVDTKPAQDVPQPQPYKPAADGAVATAQPESGASYLQVTALPRADAESVVRSLREQSFPAILAESSKDGLFRVLVGPYHQTAQLAESKARLKTLGFANAFVQKQ